MSPEEKSMLERTYKMVEENNSILKSIRRANRLGVVIKVIYWALIVGLSIGAFYFIQPLINTMTDLIGNGSVTNTGGNSTELLDTLQDLLK